MTDRIQGVLEIYEALHLRDRELSKRRFARDYLGRCESYLFSTKYYQRDISDSALLKLRQNLAHMSGLWGELYAESQRDRFLAYKEELERLSKKAESLLLSG